MLCMYGRVFVALMHIKILHHTNSEVWYNYKYVEGHLDAEEKVSGFYCIHMSVIASPTFLRNLHPE